jgi:hypothetical protein
VRTSAAPGRFPSRRFAKARRRGGFSPTESGAASALAASAKPLHNPRSVDVSAR